MGAPVVGAFVGDAVVGAMVATVGGAAVGDAVPGAGVGARCDGRTPSYRKAGDVCVVVNTKMDTHMAANPNTKSK